ncbi:MAG: DUF503 domain-containing protein [Phycisphaerales bacterium]
MKLALLQFELLIAHAQSLKDKRRVVKSLKDRLHREHMVAVAEVGRLDDHRTALLAVAAVGSDVAHLQRVLSIIVEKLRSAGDAQLGTVSGRVIDAPDVDEDGIDFDTLLSGPEVNELRSAGERALLEERA